MLAYELYIECKNNFLFVIVRLSEGLVLTDLPFGWKISPLIYHTVTEALAMYIRS